MNRVTDREALLDFDVATGDGSIGAVIDEQMRGCEILGDFCGTRGRFLLKFSVDFLEIAKDARVVRGRVGVFVVPGICQLEDDDIV